MASPAHIERHGAPGTLADLAARRCLTCHRSGAAVTWNFDHLGDTAAVRVGHGFAINGSESLRVCMLGGGGIALPPPFAVGPAIGAGRAVILLERYRPRGPFGEHLCAVYVHNRFLAPEVRVFVGYLLEKIGATPYRDDF